jgi:translocator protein
MPDKNMSLLRQWIGLAIFVAICFAAAGVGSLFTTPVIPEWYARLRKPPWTPPNWVFGPVWSALYLAMAVAAWLVWRKKGLAGAAIPMTLFFVQLVLNVGWSFLFFGLQRPGLAFAEIILLWLAILATLIAFWHVALVAGLLLLPYLLWVTFAAALNFAIWRMNI